MSRTLRADAVRNRERLVSAASELFTEQGVDVPLDQIARRAGVSIGTLYNHFPDRGRLIDEVMPERLTELDRLAEAALTDPDPWHGLTVFLETTFALQARDRSINDAVARSQVGPAGIAAECGRSGGTVDSIMNRARSAGLLRSDFGPADLGVLVRAMAHVISIADGDDQVWRRHLSFLLEGVRAR
ncbi:TetR/AcrR family transcriptional regulator [Pseudonocardia alni]|uniref:TetR/AcrR family transcriptional regulator n=1 Tax=Pseudonocardia alni TaxID=33907 RepID=UPI00280A7922|nr:TetR/AcrR family transcriptional regulator [Pseudonocardia alni]